jgi:serine/threonine protein kinase
MKLNHLIQIQECKFLGAGAEGSVYLTKDGLAIKAFKKIKNAKDEEEILNSTKDSPFFPKCIVRASNIIIREYVEGENLFEYISKYGLSYKLSKEIIDLIEDFKRLNFKRLNIRNTHIFVNQEGTIKVIDPRKPFTKITPYPRDIIEILIKAHVFDKFLQYLLKYKPELLSFWTEGYRYLSSVRKRRVRKYA